MSGGCSTGCREGRRVTDVDAELLQLFRDESTERLDRFVEMLLAVERGTAPERAVDALFREAHTIKGAAGMLCLDEVRELAHGAEDLLACIREQDTIPLELVGVLLRTADALRLQIDGTGGSSTALLMELVECRARIVAGLPVEEKPEPAVAAVERQEPVPTERAEEQRSVRVPAEKIDRLLDLVGETVLHQRRLEHELVSGDHEPGRDESVTDELDVGARLFDELKTAAISMRTRPLSSILGSLPRSVRDLAVEQGKEVDLAVIGAETELDRIVLESLSEPLVHLIRNAVGHGIEPPDEREAAGKPRRGRLEVRAEQRGQLVEITVADDGRGVSRAVLEEAKTVGSLAEVLARPGYSTADSVTELSGRGVGLDAVKTHAETFGGSLEVRSEPGRGTDIVLRLPLALALIDVLLVERGGSVYGIPLGAVEEVLSIERAVTLLGKQALNLRGQSLALDDLADLIQAAAPPLPEGAPAVVVASGRRRIAVGCDRLLGKEEVLLGSLGPLLEDLDAYLGAAILGDGAIALILDPASLTCGTVSRPERPAIAQVDAVPVTPKVLVVEDSFTVRELQRSILEAAGYRVETARDGQEALECVSRNGIDLVLTDIEMPRMDGLELTRAIRDGSEHASLPVVILTSRGDDDDRRAGIEAGADAYMVKRGFDQQALLETVERLVGR
jgi:two-component system chemotaxis sensor kinase CheA